MPEIDFSDGKPVRVDEEEKDYRIEALSNGGYAAVAQTTRAQNKKNGGIKKGERMDFQTTSHLSQFIDAAEGEGLTFEGKELMQSLEDLLKNTPFPKLEVLAGAVLERIAKINDDVIMGNFASSVTNWTPHSSPRPESANMIFESFQWLLSRGLIAKIPQEGVYFVTRKGKAIGTAAKLKAELESEKLLPIFPITVENGYEAAKLKKEATSAVFGAIEEAKSRAKLIAEETKIEAQSILNLARETAQKVSLSDVQSQFEEAAKKSRTGIYFWGGLSLVLIAVFLYVLIAFWSWWAPQSLLDDNIGSKNNVTSAFVIYHTVLRITFLTALAAIATFCLKILRAQLHLRELNLHRQRIANSMAAFLGAASQEQRDMILGRMVDAITTFGNSGLLSDNDESMSPAKIVLESISKAMPQK
jgi:hypothetical protein